MLVTCIFFCSYNIFKDPSWSDVGKHMPNWQSFFLTYSYPLFLTLSQMTNFRLFKTEKVLTTISNLMKMVEGLLIRYKTLWEKEKLPFPTAFSKYSITCTQRPLKGSNESGILQQVVFKCRFY